MSVPVAIPIRFGLPYHGIVQNGSLALPNGGAITAFVYSTDPAYLARSEQEFSESGAQLTCNLTGPMPLNFAAAYSDYHVTGLNPAGNATLTDLAFVASRFRITQVRAPETA